MEKIQLLLTTTIKKPLSFLYLFSEDDNDRRSWVQEVVHNKTSASKTSKLSWKGKLVRPQAPLNHSKPQR